MGLLSFPNYPYKQVITPREIRGSKTTWTFFQTTLPDNSNPIGSTFAQVFAFEEERVRIKTVNFNIATPCFS